MPLTVEDVRELLGSGHDAWRPREGEAWKAFVRRKAPGAPGFWQPFARASFHRALALALLRGERRDVFSRALVLPFWVGNNEDEVARDDEWSPAAVVVSDSDELLFDVPLAKKAPIWARCDLTRVKGAFVTASRHYALGVPNMERFGPFAVVDTTVHTLVDAVSEGDRVELAPPPARMVPAFSMHYVPAFDPARVPAEIADAAARVAAKLTFEPDDAP